jgi:hypothetical protein
MKRTILWSKKVIDRKSLGARKVLTCKYPK